jgi:putative hydroxymethylpyrimidine transporter CytX
MVTEVQPLGVPRSDLAAATIGVERVPDRFRVLGFFDYFVLWADLGVGLLVLLAGTALVPGLGFWEAIAAILVGTLIGNVMLGLAGVVGSDNAIPSMVSLRPAFGQRGSYLPSLINVVQLVGWGAFELVIMAQASARVTQSLFGASSYPLWVIFWGIVVTLFALGGPLIVVRQWLGKAGIWIVLVTGAWMVIYVVSHANFDALVSRHGDGSLGFAQAIDLVVAMPISWLPLVADFNRFAKTSRSSFWGTVSGFAVSNVLFFTLGVLLILVLPGSDLIGSIMTIAFGTAGLALLLGDETDNAFADVYSGAISIKNVLPTLSTRLLVTSIGGVCLVIALIVDLTSFQGFLYLVGSLFTPLFGVLFADYFILKRRRYASDELYPEDGQGRSRSGTNPVALLAWGCGIATYLAETTYVGWLGGTLPSLAVSLIVYLAVSLAVERIQATARA